MSFIFSYISIISTGLVGFQQCRLVEEDISRVGGDYLFRAGFRSQTWWIMPVVSAHRRLRQEDCSAVQVNMSCKTRP